MSTQIQLGSILDRGNTPQRVVRIIHESLTLYEGEGETPFIIRESYAELKGADGGMDFLTLSREKLPYDGPQSLIRGLEPISWKEDDHAGADAAGG